VKGCPNQYLAKGLCLKHYTRKLRHGETSDPREITKRFWSKVEKSEECWLWKRHCDKDGYGTFSVGRRFNNTTVNAPRMAWTLTNGEIPKGMCVLHKCDNPPCVRPDHLFLGNHLENARDKVLKGRQSKGIKNGNSAYMRRRRLCKQQLSK
jgi:hypothetical protein